MSNWWCVKNGEISHYLAGRTTRIALLKLLFEGSKSSLPFRRLSFYSVRYSGIFFTCGPIPHFFNQINIAQIPSNTLTWQMSNFWNSWIRYTVMLASQIWSPIVQCVLTSVWWPELQKNDIWDMIWIFWYYCALFLSNGSSNYVYFLFSWLLLG